MNRSRNFWKLSGWAISIFVIATNCSEASLDSYGCGCRINGICFATGIRDPHDTCHLCDPNFSPFSWAPAEGCVVTLAGDGVAGYRDGLVTQARLNGPEEIAFGLDGRLYIADAHNHRVRMIYQGKVSTVAGSGLPGLEDGPVSTAKIRGPRGIAADSSGNIYIGQSSNESNEPAVRLIAEGQVTTLNAEGFNYPTSVAVFSNEIVYVADPLNHHILGQIISSGQTFILGKGEEGYLDGPLEKAMFNEPWGLGLSKDGRQLFVADKGNHRIRLVDIENQMVSTVTGSPDGFSSGFLDGPKTVALIKAPEAIAIDETTGAIVFSDSGNHAIRRISDSEVTTLAGDGNAGLIDGLSINARFNWPTGVAVDSEGRIYVGDTFNNCIRVIRPFK